MCYLTSLFGVHALCLIETLAKAREHNFAKLAEGLSAEAAVTKRLHGNFSPRRLRQNEEKRKRERAKARREERKERWNKNTEKGDKIWKSAVSISRGNPLRSTSSSQSLARPLSRSLVRSSSPSTSLGRSRGQIN